mmetsp:Transcript_74739/g.188964  ORF Transcript_74739/g.188964 Transcript_74739/m.188964 type:complete len:262 (+) Transcript_74739:187-972(+)
MAVPLPPRPGKRKSSLRRGFWARCATATSSALTPRTPPSARCRPWPVWRRSCGMRGAPRCGASGCSSTAAAPGGSLARTSIRHAGRSKTLSRFQQRATSSGATSKSCAEVSPNSWSSRTSPQRKPTTPSSSWIASLPRRESRVWPTRPGRSSTLDAPAPCVWMSSGLASPSWVSPEIPPSSSVAWTERALAGSSVPISSTCGRSRKQTPRKPCGVPWSSSSSIGRGSTLPLRKILRRISRLYPGASPEAQTSRLCCAGARG